MTSHDDEWDDLYDRLFKVSADIEQNARKLENHGLDRAVASLLGRLERDLKHQVSQIMKETLAVIFSGGQTGVGQNGIGQVLSALLPRLAKGGVVDGATGFAIGGEAGPEAVLPLKRMADGRLGVAMEGKGTAASSLSSAATPQIHVTLQSPTEPGAGFSPANAAPDELAELISRAIDDAIDVRLEEQLRHGGTFRRLGG
jgi:phage-related minor tail protein